jgi:diguanylate cyclase
MSTLSPGFLKRNALLVCAYALAGFLSLRFMAPTDYATPLFPPSGIALACLLIYGRRLWPAVLIGSFVVEIAAALQYGTSGIAWVGPLLVPIAATLQALAGYWLAQKLVGFPNALDTPRAIVRFLGIVAPLACLVGASISIPVLVASGAIAHNVAAISWWRWWFGDTLGILISAPLVFVFFGLPRRDWRPRRWSVTLPMLAALMLIALIYTQIHKWEDLRIEAQFAHDAEHVGSLVMYRLDAQADMVRSLERLVQVKRDFTRRDWREFVSPWLNRYPGSLNFSWAPFVDRASRPTFEAYVREVDWPDFRILARVPAGGTNTAPEAHEYLPYLYVEPIDSNRAIVGLDPSTLPQVQEAIRQSRLTGQPVASAPFRLLQERQNQRGVVVYLAVIDPESGLESVSRPLVGLVSGAMRMDDALAGALHGSDADGIEVCLADLDADADNRHLAGPADCETAAWLDGDIHHVFPLNFASRHWQLSMRPTTAYLGALRSWAIWATLLTGIGVTSLLGALLLLVTGRSQRITELVAQRTNELAEAGKRLQEQQQTLSRAQQIAHLGSWEAIPGSEWLHSSEELMRMLRIDGQYELSFDRFIAHIDTRDRPDLQMALDEAREVPGSHALDCQLLAGNEEEVRICHFQIESEWQNGVLHRLRGTVQDVTAAREAEAHIQYLAHYDALTGLPNRTLWNNRTRIALSTAQRHGDILAILFLDLDQFKTVNDSLGHPIGDRLLATVAERLQTCLREEDLLARLGGDEFVVLLPRLARADDAATVARKLLASLAETIAIDEHELSASVSIGIALFPDDGSDLDTLLKHADIAMYGAKEAGRNNFQFFVQDMNARAFERLMLENSLRRAIERSELVLHFQAQVDAASARVLGCEALVRWQHPDMGLIPPAQFIPVAEDSGLIVPLGEWVLEAGCRQQVAWAAAGHIFDIAINISALQFRKADFVVVVERVLAETGADPHHIELEITESALMQPTDELMARLYRLRALGLRLALDDFGTGYSSLSYLKRLPISRLKLDRSFVMDLPGDPEDAAIASATLSLAHDLGLEVIAEGVETFEQQQYLVARGCQILQGFRFGKPLPADDFLREATRNSGRLNPS